MLSDMHTQRELTQFEQTLRTHDAVNGKLWQHPMPPTDIHPDDPRYIDFRKAPHPPHTDPRHEDLLASLRESTLLERKHFTNEQHEIDALSSSYDAMHSDVSDAPAQPFSMSGNVDVPPPDQFARWQAEANARGGAATRDESYFLPPFKQHPPHHLHLAHPPQPLVAPHQQATFAHANRGAWQGTVTVFSLQTAQTFAPRVTACFSVNTCVRQCADGAVAWNSTASTHSLEFVSNVRVPSPKHAQALVPGRAVSAEGCYVVCRKNAITRHDTDLFTMSRACLASLAHNKRCRPELEIAITAQHQSLPVRHRIFLCTSAAEHEPKQTGMRNGSKFSHIVVLKEFQTHSAPTAASSSHSGAVATAPTTELSLQSTSAAKLLGLWQGHGVIFHPEYPPESCVQVSTTYETSNRSTITESDVTWVENHIPDDPNHVSRRRQRTAKKKKLSQRVREARAHDRRRLSECHLLTRQVCGQAHEEEKFAWNAIPSMEAFSWMYSPRTGHFAGDYAALLVSKQVLVKFPVSEAFPQIWNTVSAIELNTPSRLRIEAGRNDEGTLVGALFVKEKLEDAAESDAVVSYV
eukprot:gb/GEZJ01001112.1/.p1 GENE.gb/GEZJ01001112.1/~~gb/GEZJ01001112.1/.p1  ORF type:complete len:591 (-),score=79.63 gb/GEZJ01001112.1/:3228-4961(-)